MIQALTRAQVIAQWPTGGDITLTDLWTGETFTARSSPPRNYDHSDWMFKTKADFDISRKITGRSWNARPAILRTPSGCVSAVSYHTLNHSIVVASGAYNIVSPTLTRATEKDKNGNWVPGHHMCMHYEDSYKARSNTSYTRDMRDKVLLAVTLANQGSIGDPPLTKGASNSIAVKELQRLLNENGANPQLSVDGGFGALTEAALNEFKTRVGLTPNGTADQFTWDALRNTDKKGITDVEDEELKTVYNKVEQIPEWARPTIAKLVDAKVINGINAAGDLNLNDDLLRMIVLQERIATSGVYK